MNTTLIESQKRPKCYLCGQNGNILYPNLQDRLFGVPGTWSLRSCTNEKCEFIWLDPMPKPNEIWKLYQNYYTHSSNQEEKAIAPLRFLSNPFKRTMLGVHFGYKELIDNFWIKSLVQLLGISPLRREKIGRTILWARGDWRKRVLDVGCGSGNLLHTLNQLGWECVGFEPDPAAASAASKRCNLKIYEKDFSSILKYEKPFDLITSSHVIEHLLDPIQDLKNYSKLLQPGGKIIIVTPNIESLGSFWFNESWYALDPPRHLHLFSKKTLAHCIEQAGLEIDFIRTSASSFKSIWHRSGIIKKEKVIGGGPYRKPPLHKRLGSRGFELLENLLISLNKGEELIAIAHKRL